jgi:hypothetical protein
MALKDGEKVFIKKDYSNAAGKLHLSFHTLNKTIQNELTDKLEQINN